MKFTIVTPAYNMKDWIEETIKSVLSQTGDFEIEYIIVDGGSNDSSVEIIKKYEKLISTKNYPIKCLDISLKFLKQKSTGMYGAINEGFKNASGDVLAWINADDIYEAEALNKISLVLKTFPDIQWVKGITSTIDEQGEKIRKGKCRLYRQDWLALGIYGMESYFVEQDSVFWRKELWEKTGKINEKYKIAGDYYLWIQFAKHSPLWSINTPISCFRKRQGQLSKNIINYKKEQLEIRPKRNITAWKVKSFFTPESRLVYRFPKFNKLFLYLYNLFFFSKNEYIFIKANKPQKGLMKSYQIL